MNYEELVICFKKIELNQKAQASGRKLAKKVFDNEKHIFAYVCILIVLAVLNLDFSIRVILSPIFIALALFFIMFYQSRFNSTIYKIYFINCDVDLLLAFIVSYFELSKKPKRRLADFTFAFMLILFELEKYDCIINFFHAPKKLKLHRNHLLIVYLAAIYKKNETIMNEIKKYELTHKLFNETFYKKLKDDVEIIYHLYLQDKFSEITKINKNNYDCEMVKLYYEYLDIMCYKKLEETKEYDDKINKLLNDISDKNPYYLKKKIGEMYE